MKNFLLIFMHTNFVVTIFLIHVHADMAVDEEPSGTPSVNLGIHIFTSASTNTV